MLPLLTLLLAGWSPAHAIGLGEAQLRSALEQPLNVNISLSGLQESDVLLSCVKVKINSINGDFVANPLVEFVFSDENKLPRYLHVTSRTPIQEPAITLSIVWSCGTRVVREYTLLLDLSDSAAATPSMPSTRSTAVDATLSARTESVPATATASVASSAVSSVSASPKNKGAHHSVPVAASSAATTAIVPAPATLKTAPENPSGQVAETGLKKSRAVSGRNVLKLGSDDESSVYDLKISTSLSMVSKQTTDDRSSREIKVAQAEFAARLRGEDPLAAVQAQLANAQKKIIILQQDNAAGQSAKQDKNQQSASASQGNSSWFDFGESSIVWILVLGILLILTLTALILLAIRLRRHRSESVWWEPPESKSVDVEEIVNGLQADATTGTFDPAPIVIKETIFGMEPEMQESATGSVNAIDIVAAKATRIGLPLLEDTNSSTFNFFSPRGNSLKVEEISDVIQEAEFWMSVNDPHRAIEILEPQAVDDNPDSPVPWLYLLDLYKLVDDQAKYELLRHRFKAKFNANIPLYEEEVDPENTRVLEDFSHLIDKICGLWFTHEILPFLESLLIDDRDGARVGFDLPVYRDILLLIAISNELERTQTLRHSAPRQPVPASEHNDPPAPVYSHRREDGKLQVTPTPQGESLNFELLDFKLDEINKAG